MSSLIHGLLQRGAEPRGSVVVGVALDPRAAGARHPDSVALNGGVDLAAATVLLEGGTKIGEEGHVAELKIEGPPGVMLPPPSATTEPPHAIHGVFHSATDPSSAR